MAEEMSFDLARNQNIVELMLSKLDWDEEISAIDASYIVTKIFENISGRMTQRTSKNCRKMVSSIKVAFCDESKQSDNCPDPSCDSSLNLTEIIKLIVATKSPEEGKSEVIKQLTEAVAVALHYYGKGDNNKCRNLRDKIFLGACESEGDCPKCQTDSCKGRKELPKIEKTKPRSPDANALKDIDREILREPIETLAKFKELIDEIDAKISSIEVNPGEAGTLAAALAQMVIVRKGLKPFSAGVCLGSRNEVAWKWCLMQRLAGSCKNCTKDTGYLPESLDLFNSALTLALSPNISIEEKVYQAKYALSVIMKNMGVQSACHGLKDSAGKDACALIIADDGCPYISKEYIEAAKKLLEMEPAGNG